MRGLMGPESEGFKKFFALIQEEAEKQGAVFFAFCGEGRDIVTQDMEGEDMSGWLIPEDRAEEFEKLWEKGSSLIALEEWGDFLTCAIWGAEGGRISIRFM